MAKAKKEAATRLTIDEAVERLVGAAIKLLAEKGPMEIKVRSVAEAAQVSTVAVYYHMGGLPELMQAVVDKGFRELGRAFDAVPPSDDPVSDLFAMALGTRRLAQANPHLYDPMGSTGPSEPLLDRSPATPSPSTTGCTANSWAAPPTGA